MKQNLRVSLGAVVLALATLAAMIFALLNFDQRARYELAYDGVARLDTDHGVQAKQVSPNSPATRAGIHANDVLLSINGARVTRATEVARRLDRAGLWTQVRYKLSRNGEEFETPLVTAPAEKPLATENYLRVVGLLFLFIGLFIFVRGGMPRVPCTFMSFAWFLSSVGPSTTAESLTLLTGKSIGRRSWHASSHRPCCSISPWSSRGARKQRFARPRSSWPCMPCLSFCS